MAYSSPEMRSTDLLTCTIRPWLLRVERAVSGLLPRTHAARFNAGGMVWATLAVRDGGDGRTLEGPLLPWGVEARVLDRGRLVVETFERGALVDVDPARVSLTATHPGDAGTLPIGVTLDRRARRRGVGFMAREQDGAGRGGPGAGPLRLPLGLSVGFLEVPGGSRWLPDRRRVTRTRAALDHVAVVRVAAYAGAGVVGVRVKGAPAAGAPLATLARRWR
jgi:hypothetical protein